MSTQNNIIIAVQAVNKTTNILNQVNSQINKISSSFGKFNNAVGNVFSGIATWKILSNSLRVAKDFIVQTTQEFANLADSADMAGISSAANLDSLVKALDLVGVKGVSIDKVANAFSRMTKATGATDMPGFFSTLNSISQLNTEQERLNELIRIFGKDAGASFAVITRGGSSSVTALAEMTQAWQTNSDAQINAFAELDGAWTRICDDITFKFRDSIAQIVMSITGASELSELAILKLYEKVKFYAVGISRAIIAPFKLLYSFINGIQAAITSFFTTFVGGIVRFLDKELGDAILEFANKKYEKYLKFEKMFREAGDVISSNLMGDFDSTTHREYNDAIAKWENIFRNKEIIDKNKLPSDLANSLDDAADAINESSKKLENSSSKLADASNKISTAFKTTGFVGAGSSAALKIKTMSRDWMLQGDRGTASSIQIGADIPGVLRSECRKITDLEAQILFELRNKPLIGEV